MSSAYKRPRFVREESWRYKRVKESWRSPRGKTSRVRRSKKGWPPVVKIGYSHPKATRGIHPSGLREVTIWRPADLQSIDPRNQVGRIAHTVGEKKRVQIIEEAKKKDIRILNPGLKRAPEPKPEPAPPETPETPETSEPAEEEKKLQPTKKRTKRRASRKTKRKRSR